MSDNDPFRRLLSGEMSPEELADNPQLIVMARRIYGKSALEDLGISLPPVELDIKTDQNIGISDIEFPETQEIPTDFSHAERNNNDPSIFRSVKFILSNPKPRRIILLALIIRILLAPWASHQTDVTAYFLGVSDMIPNADSPYASLDFPYPPVLMIILFPIFKILSQFSDPGNWASTPDEMGVLCSEVSICTTIVPSSTFNFFFKLPLIVSDIISGIVIFTIISSFRNFETSQRGMAIYLLNPLTIWVSSVLGQSDSMLAMFVLLSIYYLIKDDLISSGIMFGLSVMTKGYSLPLAVFIGSFAVLFKKTNISTSFSMGREEIVRSLKIGIPSMIVAISLTIPLITIGGAQVIFSRQIQRPFRPGGVSPFSLARFDFVPTEKINEGGIVLAVLETLHSIGLEYFIGLIIAFYLYKKKYGRNLGREESLILGCTAHVYFLIFLLGSVNAQYLVILVGMMTISILISKSPEVPIRLLYTSTIFAALFGIGIVSMTYDLIPLAANTDLLDLSRLVESISTQWSSPGLLTSTAREDRMTLFGFASWFFITCSFIFVIKRIFEREVKSDV